MSKRTRASSEHVEPIKIRCNVKIKTTSTMCYDVGNGEKYETIDFVATTVKNSSTILCQFKNTKGNQNTDSHGTIVMPIIEIFPGYRCITNDVIS